jgi:tol-pal system protein YbgF
MKHMFLLGCVLALFFLTGCVTPEQYQILENRVNALEMDNNRQMAFQAEFGRKQAALASTIGALEKKLQSEDQDFRENIADIKYELTRAQEDYGRLQGMIEELGHQFGAAGHGMHQDLGKRLDRIDNAVSRNHVRITRLETYMGFEPTASAPVDPDRPPEDLSGADAQTGKPVSDKAAYESAKKVFDDGDMEAARIQFENFINTFPESPYAGNARFWIADSYYAEKWYEKAILEYQKVLEQYPDSNKTAAARLKQGYAFAELGESANARLILNELISRYPDSREAGFAKEKLKQLQ